MRDKKQILIGFVGDVVIDRNNPSEVFDKVGKLLGAPDILFANLESPYSDAPPATVSGLIALVPPAHNLDAYAPAGFHIMSMANNHIVDGGHAVMLETRTRLRDQGVATIGVGENLADARKPAILVRDGLKVGFLGYASLFPHGYQARSNLPGLAPLRAYNHYHEMPEVYCPGRLPEVETLPDPTDHRNMEQDIEALRKEVDILIASFHWGDHFRPFFLTDHERRTARRCIDLGVDLVLGHHHHALRGVEWYKGKPIFYGLGHFVFDCKLNMTPELKAYFDTVDPESYAVYPREGWPFLPLHPDTRMTMLGWASVSGNSITDVGFVPCRLLADGKVIALDPDEPQGAEVVDYLAKCNRSQKLNGRITAESAPSIGGHKSLRVMPNAS